MNELNNTNLFAITAEIKVLKSQTAQNIIEIGKRLSQAKEMLPHGQWAIWLEERVDLAQTTATRFMRVAKEFSNLPPATNLSSSKLFELLALPAEEREVFIKESPVEDMTKKELREAIKAKKELEKQMEDLRNKPPKVEVREVEKVPSDYYEMKKKMERLERDLLNKDHDLEVAKAQSTLLERKAQLNEKEAKQYQELKTQINQLTKQKDDLGRQIQARTELSGLIVRVEHLLKTELAPIKYSRAIDEAADDEIVIRNLANIVDRVSQWCQEMDRFIPNRRSFVEVINSEVIYSD